MDTSFRVERALHGEPLDRFVARRVQEDAATVDEENAGRELERPRDAVLGEDDRGPQPLDGCQEERGRFGIELRGRLVEEQQPRLERKRRSKADPLQLATGELGRLAAPEVERIHRFERPLDPRPDLARRNADVFEPEGDLVRDDGHHDLVLGILEDRRNGAGKLGRPGPPSIEPGDDDPTREAAPVEVRHESGERAQQRRLAGPGGTEESHDLSRLERQRHVPQRRRRRRVRERQAVDGD